MESNEKNKGRITAQNGELGLGDIVSFGWEDGYSTGTVMRTHADGTVDVFRPYTHTSDVVWSGGEEGSLSVLCYIGYEEVKRMNPSRLKILRKARGLR